MDFDFEDEDSTFHTSLQSNFNVPQVDFATSYADTMPEPNEELFVSARASQRRRGYTELGAALCKDTAGITGAMAQRFTPWFREMLMDPDVQAFTAACEAVASHYRSIMAQADGIGGGTVQPIAWLPTLAERLLRDDVSRSSSSIGAAVELVKAAARCHGARLWLVISNLLKEATTCHSALRLLSCCVERGVCGITEVGPLLQGAADADSGPLSCHRSSACEDAAVRAGLAALFAVLPSLRAELPPNFERDRCYKRKDGRPSPGEVSVSPKKPSSCGGHFDAPLDVLRVLGESSVKSWRVRLKCLQEIDGMDGDGMHGDVLLPNLVLQAEDDHPAVATAAFRAIACIAERLHDFGDLLSIRLATAMRGRFREGRSRCTEAAGSCVAQLARHGVLPHAASANFLAQAFGCTRDVARATLFSLLEELSAENVAEALGLPPSLEVLIRTAVSPRRAARRASSAPGTPSPQSEVQRKRGAILGASPCTPVEHVAAMPSVLLGMPPFSLDNGEEVSGIAEFRQQSSVTPARYCVTPMTANAADRSGDFFGTPERFKSSSTPSHQDRRSTGRSRLSGCSESSMVFTPPPRARVPTQAVSNFSSTPQARYTDEDGVVGSPSPVAAPVPRIRVIPTSPNEGAACGAGAACAVGAVASVDLIGPQLRADSQLLSPSRISLSVAVPPSLVSSPVPAMHTIASPSAIVLRSEQDSSMVSPAAAAFLTAVTPAQRVTSPPSERSQLVAYTPSSACSARVSHLCNAAAAGLHALEEGGDPTAWHEALRALAAWEPGQDGLRGDAAAKAVVELLLDAAPRLRPEARPEIWRALSELRSAPWLSQGAILELAIGHCLLFTETSVVAAFLYARVQEERLSLDACVDFCLARLPRSDGQRACSFHGACASSRLGSLLQGLLESPGRSLQHQVHQRSQGLPLADLTLVSLPAAVEWAMGLPARHAALTSVRASFKLLLRHLSPEFVPERCWSQLCQLLGRPSEHAASSLACPRQTSDFFVSSCSSTAMLPGYQEIVPRHTGRRAVPPAHLATDAVAIEVIESADEPDDQRVGEDREDRFRRGASDEGGVSDQVLELQAAFAKLHKLSTELASAQRNDVASTLQLVTQVLARPQLQSPLRAFLRRVLVRQRQKEAVKENLAPQAGTPAKHYQHQGDYLENDYASIREAVTDEGLLGSFPHSLLAPLKCLLSSPACAGTHRAAIDCLSSLAVACGPVLLRVLAQQFVSPLFRLASVRGPAQAKARGLLSSFAGLAGPSSLRSLRQVWRALVHEAGFGHRSFGGATSPSDSGHLLELLRWLGEDVLPQPGRTLEGADVREFLRVIGAALRDRSSTLRIAAARALRAIAQVRGGDEPLRVEVHDHEQLSGSARAAILRSLDGAAPPTLPVPAMPPAPRIFRTPSLAELKRPGPSGMMSASSSRASKPRRLRFSPTTQDSLQDHSLNSSASAPDLRRLSWGVPIAEAQSPTFGDTSERDESTLAEEPPFRDSANCKSSAERARVKQPRAPPFLTEVTCSSSSGGSAGAHDLETELSSWSAELSYLDCDGSPLSSVHGIWAERTNGLNKRLETFFHRHAAPEAGRVIPAMLVLCKSLVVRCASGASGADTLMTVSTWPLEAALVVVRAARASFTVAALRGLSGAAAAASFRAILQALAHLQQFSQVGASEPTRRAAAPLLLELPPVLARLIDNLEVSVQLVAWVRVAGEVLAEDGSGLAVGDHAPGARRWALRFCTRCVDRCAPLLPPGGPDFPAWEVLSELSRMHERRRPECVSASCASETAWAADCDTWCQTLAGAARIISRQYPAQTREFLLLASCTGSPVPCSLERFFEAELTSPTPPSSASTPAQT